MTSGGNSFHDFPDIVPTAEKSQPKQRRLFSFSRPCRPWTCFLNGPNAAASVAPTLGLIRHCRGVASDGVSAYRRDRRPRRCESRRENFSRRRCSDAFISGRERRAVCAEIIFKKLGLIIGHQHKAAGRKTSYRLDIQDYGCSCRRGVSITIGR